MKKSQKKKKKNNSFKDFVYRSKVIKFFYSLKIYSEIASSQVGFVTGKLPEVMAVIYLLSIIGYAPTKDLLIFIVAGFVLSMLLFGVFMKKTGLYDIDVYTRVSKDPFQSEVLKFVRKKK